MYVCMYARIHLCIYATQKTATWERELFCLECFALAGLKGHHVIKYYAPISPNLIMVCFWIVFNEKERREGGV